MAGQDLPASPSSDGGWPSNFLARRPVRTITLHRRINERALLAKWRLWQEWRVIEAALLRSRMGRIGEAHDLGPGDEPSVPQTFAQYVVHRTEFARLMQFERDRRIEADEEHDEAEQKMGGPAFSAAGLLPRVLDGRGTVLGKPTIWTPHLAEGVKSQRNIADWPSAEEFREEGDERHTSNFGRFLPIPREPTNLTVNYKHRHFKTPFQFDTIHPVPIVNAQYPGLDFDSSGSPVDDPNKPGKVAYVEKNPFDAAEQAAYQAQKVDDHGGEALISALEKDPFRRTLTPPHELAKRVRIRPEVNAMRAEDFAMFTRHRSNTDSTRSFASSEVEDRTASVFGGGVYHEDDGAEVSSDLTSLQAQGRLEWYDQDTPTLNASHMQLDLADNPGFNNPNFDDFGFNGMGLSDGLTAEDMTMVHEILNLQGLTLGATTDNAISTGTTHSLGGGHFDPTMNNARMPARGSSFNIGHAANAFFMPADHHNGDEWDIDETPKQRKY